MVGTFVFVVICSHGVNVYACIVESRSDTEVTSFEDLVDLTAHVYRFASGSSHFHCVSVMSRNDDLRLSSGHLDIVKGFKILSHAGISVNGIIVGVLFE